MLSVTHSDEGVSVETADGKTHEADYVILTVPLGVLKRDETAGGIAFEPPLSRTSQTTLQSCACPMLLRLLVLQRPSTLQMNWQKRKQQ